MERETHSGKKGNKKSRGIDETMVSEKSQWEVEAKAVKGMIGELSEVELIN